MSDQRIRNSEFVPGVLSSALKEIQKKTAEKKTVSAPTHFVNHKTSKLPIKVAMKRRKLIARGSGVFEDENTGDIWYREGEHLVKRNDFDVTDIVEKYLESCKGT